MNLKSKKIMGVVSVVSIIGTVLTAIFSSVGPAPWVHFISFFF